MAIKVQKEYIDTPVKESKLKDMIKIPKFKAKKMDCKLTIEMTEKEYDNLMSYLGTARKGPISFVMDCIRNPESLSELISPQFEQSTQPWKTFELEEEEMVALKEAANKSGLPVNDFVRALIWTNIKVEREKIAASEKRRKELYKTQQGFAINFSLNGEQLVRFENKYGRINSPEQARSLVFDIIEKDLNNTVG